MRRAVPLAFAGLVTGPLLSALFLTGCPEEILPPLDAGMDAQADATEHDAAPDVDRDAPESDAPPDSPPDAPTDGPPSDGGMHFCDLPGSVQHTSGGTVVLPGGPAGHDLSWMSLPTGFCAHWFGHVGNTRQLRFAPGGELFVASPTTITTGGGSNGQSAIVVLQDANQDGLADAPVTFLSGLPSTQGLLFAPGYFYYQDGTKIMRVPYQTGDVQPSAASEMVADITFHVSSLHWPKAMDMADDGTIYVGNGGDQGDTCVVPHTFIGAIVKLDGSPGGTPIVKGLRNPIALRCAKGHGQCFALELAKDYSTNSGGREKLFVIRNGDDWGFPCCATKNTPYSDIAATDCTGVQAESESFLIGGTPFGFDFAPASWPGQWSGRAYVALHGAAGTWAGARMVSVAMDPITGLPVTGSDLGGTSTGGMVDFATGWDDQTLTHGRPASIEFSPDGRLFLGNDTTGDIVWIAPMD